MYVLSNYNYIFVRNVIMYYLESEG